MTLKALKPNDKKLRQICDPISLSELRTNKIQALIDEMLDFVYGRNNKGVDRNKARPMTVGLSANQLGILKQISIVDLAIGRKFNDIHTLINPKIIWHSKSTFLHREGCVNLPEIWGEVKRYKEIKVEALDRSGNQIIIHAKGWTSVLLQHELDHLSGNLFIDHLNDSKKAHKVTEDNMIEYRKNYKEWDKFIDVSKLLKK